MKTGQGSRFMLTVRKYYIEQKKSILTLCGSFIGFAAFLGIWMGSLSVVPGEATTILAITTTGFVLAVLMSRTFPDLKTKEGRVATLMSPATATDKFWPRVITALVGGGILCAIAFFTLLLACRITLLCAHSVPFSWSWLPGFPYITFDGGYIASFALLIATFLFNESIFLLGAVVWPKRSFIKTLGVYAVFMIALNILLLGVFEIFSDVRVELVDMNLVPGVWICTVILLLLASGLTYLAFRKFKYAQVVK